MKKLITVWLIATACVLSVSAQSIYDFRVKDNLGREVSLSEVIKRYESRDQVATIEADMMMEVNPVLSNIMSRRSVRKYLDKPVEHEKLETVALAGINAPSAMNRQNWAVRIIEDQKIMADVKGMCRNAPNLICVCAPADGRFDLDAGLMGENMMLAAQSLGLGTCIQTGPIRSLATDGKAKAFRDSHCHGRLWLSRQ